MDIITVFETVGGGSIPSWPARIYTRVTQWTRVLRYERRSRRFESFQACQITVCNVNLVDGLIWSQEAAGSNPATQTNF